MSDLSTLSKEERLERMRHSAAHVMAEAVCEIFPDAKLGIGPPIDTGFYYDFDLPRALTQDDLPDIEERMRKRIASNVPFEESSMTREEAREKFSHQPFKIELLDDLPEGERIGLAQHAEFQDLCRGGHVERTGEIADFKLMNVAGAYWRGNEKNPMLQRIYGALFDTKEELDAYLEQIEEAAKRDHRRLGQRPRPLLVPRGVRAGPRVLAPEGRADPHADRGLLARRALPTRLRHRLHAAHRQVDALGDERPPGLLQREHVLADGHRRAGLLRQADELPVPHPDLQEHPAQLPRAADPHGRARHGVPLRALRRAARPVARARLHAGRRAHLLPPGPGARRDRGLRRLHDGLPERVRLREVPRLPGDARPERQVRRLARGLGHGDERAPRRHRRPRPARTTSTRAAPRSTARRSTSR